MDNHEQLRCMESITQQCNCQVRIPWRPGNTAGRNRKSQLAVFFELVIEQRDDLRRYFGVLRHSTLGFQSSNRSRQCV